MTHSSVGDNREVQKMFNNNTNSTSIYSNTSSITSNGYYGSFTMDKNIEHYRE